MQKSTEEKPIQDRLLRLPVVLEVIPISKFSWYAGVKVGRHPKPVTRTPHDLLAAARTYIHITDDADDGWYSLIIKHRTKANFDVA